jgi:autotransporter-associated beta strand protein
MQIESNSTGVRDTAANRTAYAQALASALEEYFATHYNISLRECVPSLWPGGGGSWATAGNWAGNVLPVSTNHFLFAGSGGVVTHNHAPLNTGTGVVSALNFSNAVTGTYTISGNAFSLLRGITNHSTFTQVINNNLTFLGSTTTVAATSGSITFGGNLTNHSSFLRVLGNVNANGIISGPGGLTKTGAGTLALTAINSYTGATTNSSGIISLNGTSTFGDGTGLLVLNGGDLLSLNTRSGAPIANPVLLAGSSTISGSGTLTNSLRILPFSANSITTTAGTLTIRHTGPIRSRRTMSSACGSPAAASISRVRSRLGSAVICPQRSRNWNPTTTISSAIKPLRVTFPASANSGVMPQTRRPPGAPF